MADKKVSSAKKIDKRNWVKKICDVIITIKNMITKQECPKCKKSGGRKTHRKFIKSFDHLETVLNEEEHYNSKEQYTGKTCGEKQVVLRTETYNIHYYCIYCGHKWHEHGEETFQP